VEYAIDTLVFCGANHDHLRYLCALFLCFEAISGLKVNMDKSELVPVGNVYNVEGFIGILGWGFFFAFEVSWFSVVGLLQGQVYLGRCC